MHVMPPGAEVAWRTRERDACLELRLVLDAAGVPAEAVFQDGWWLLVVGEGDLDVALAELAAYRDENLPAPSSQPARFGGGVPGVLAYAAVLVLVAALAGAYAMGVDWFTAGRMQAGRVLAGELWRAVTALTLHADAGHLTANLVFGTAFGLLAAPAFGGGVAWLVILLGGALGNYLNALVQQPAHSSIGASTAVFAALGLLVAHAIHHRDARADTALRRWSPLVGGVVLLAYTGTGSERTDIVAHLTGFLAGLALGAVAGRMPPAWLRRRALQRRAGAAALGLVLLSWVWALATAA